MGLFYETISEKNSSAIKEWVSNHNHIKRQKCNDSSMPYRQLLCSETGV